MILNKKQREYYNNLELKNQVELKLGVHDARTKYISSFVSIATLFFTITLALIAKNTIDKIENFYIDQTQSLVNEFSALNEQYQYQIIDLQNDIDNINTQYQNMENILTQQQTVDVIQARDNDVLIRTPDGKWIVVPMIESSDISFSSEIIEKKYTQGEIDLPRYDMFNNNEEDWTTRDSFTYTLPNLSINQNKMVSLIQFINNITIEFKLYNSNQVDYESIYYQLYEKGDTLEYLNLFENISPDYQFVTKELIGFNGIEDIKITIIIEFEIGSEVFSIPYIFNDFIPVNEDN